MVFWRIGFVAATVRTSIAQVCITHKHLITLNILTLAVNVHPVPAGASVCPPTTPKLVRNQTSTTYTLTNLQVDREIDRPG